MDLRAMQAEIDAWILQNGGYWPPHALLARLTEEVGELSREVNHTHGPKKKKASEAPSSIEAELGDVLWITLCIANAEGIDLQRSFEDTMRKVVSRDTGRFPPAR